MALFNVNAWDLSQDLWGFLLRWIGPKLYQRRTRMGQQIEGNGLELWRKIHSEFAGSDHLMQVAGRTKLQDYPAITSMKDVQHRLEEWVHLFYQFGEGITAEHANTMLVRILPRDIRTEVYRRPEVEPIDLLRLIDWVNTPVALRTGRRDTCKPCEA